MSEPQKKFCSVCKQHVRTTMKNHKKGREHKLMKRFGLKQVCGI